MSPKKIPLRVWAEQHYSPPPSRPTLHEVRSLSARLYEAQGGVDTQALAGHSSADMTAVYADPRGVEAVLVKVHRR